MSVNAVYPGTFDPITFGHLDIIKRAVAIFDRLDILVAAVSGKDTLFTLAERVELAERAVEGLDGVRVLRLEGLLSEYAREKEVRVIVRGLRMVSDFDIEFQMALTNRKLYQPLETVFLTPNESFTYLSASIVRELAQLHARLDEFVPDFVAQRLYAKFKGHGPRPA